MSPLEYMHASRSLLREVLFCTMCTPSYYYFIQSAVGTVVTIDTRVERNPLPIVIKQADCVGTEESISQCPQDNNHVCLNHGAGAICPLLVRGIHNNHHSI